MEYSKKNVLEQKCMDFSVEVVQLYKWINKNPKEYKLADQMMRAGTAVGASYGEAQYAESDSDYELVPFQAEAALPVSSGRCSGLELMQRSEIVTEEQYTRLYDDANEIQVMMGAAVRTVRGKKKEGGVRIEANNVQVNI